MPAELVVLIVALFLVFVVVWILRAAARVGADAPKFPKSDTVMQLAMWAEINGNAHGASGASPAHSPCDPTDHNAGAEHHESLHGGHHGGHHGVHHGGDPGGHHGGGDCCGGHSGGHH